MEIDVERMRAVRDAVGAAVELLIDANQGWTPPQAIAALKRMAGPTRLELATSGVTGRGSSPGKPRHSGPFRWVSQRLPKANTLLLCTAR